MYALRGIAVSLSIFFLLYAALSAVVCLIWRKVWSYGQRGSARGCSNLLFALRMVPLFVAAAVTLVLAVPSFLMLEPQATEESLGMVPLALAFGGVAVLLAGIWNAGTALLQVSRTIGKWSLEARVVSLAPVDSAHPVSVLRTFAPAPPLTVAGILRPCVWLSGTAEFVLNEGELQSAVRHEVVHVRRRDNLRKLLLRLVAAPGMGQLEGAWREATEMAADDAAVASASEALDLAAAVIKLSRLAPVQSAIELTTALVHSPAEALNARVQRLITWTESRRAATRYSVRYPLFATAAMIGAFAVTYSELLVRVHAATEWLVR